MIVLPSPTRFASRRRFRRLAEVPRAGASAGARSGHRDIRLPSLAARRPRAAMAVVVLGAGSLALGVGGPVAGLLAAVYVGLATRLMINRYRARQAGEAVARALDALAALAADLRAGLPPNTALAVALPALEASTASAVTQLAGRVAGAWQVAEAAGAPLADLLDRLDADARGLQRVRDAAAASAAGARATAWLLAALPLAGVGVGYGMGGDPLRVLLHTPLGAACAGLALVFQLAGLAWSARLSRAVVEAAG